MRHFIFQIEHLLKGGLRKFYGSGQGASENFAPLAGGHQKFYASANQENVKFIFAATISVAALHLVHAVRPVNIRAEDAKNVSGSCTLRKYVCVFRYCL